MKKILVVAVALFAASTTFAQVTFGPKVGINVSKLGYSKGDDAYTSDTDAGGTNLAWQLGGIVNINTSDKIALRTGLLLNRLSNKYSESIPFLGDVEVVISATYLRLPLEIAYRIPQGDNEFQLFAGPYLQYGISGKSKYKLGGFLSTDEAVDIKFKKEPATQTGDEIYMNPLDLGVNFGLGYRFRNILISASYALSFSNTTAFLEEEPADYDRSKEDKFKWRSFNLGVSMFFGE